jgi:hypothetical protein
MGSHTDRVPLDLPMARSLSASSGMGSMSIMRSQVIASLIVGSHCLPGLALRMDQGASMNPSAMPWPTTTTVRLVCRHHQRSSKSFATQ